MHDPLVFVALNPEKWFNFADKIPMVNISTIAVVALLAAVVAIVCFMAFKKVFGSQDGE